MDPDRIDLLALLMGRDATANPPRGGDARNPTFDQMRGTPLGMMIDVAIGMTPVGIAVDIADLASARSPAEAGLAVAGFVPILGDLLKRLGRFGARTVAGPGGAIARVRDTLSDADLDEFDTILHEIRLDRLGRNARHDLRGIQREATKLRSDETFQRLMLPRQGTAARAAPEADRRITHVQAMGRPEPPLMSVPASSGSPTRAIGGFNEVQFALPTGTELSHLTVGKAGIPQPLGPVPQSLQDLLTKFGR